MKLVLVVSFLLAASGADAQESFRIQHLGKIFHGILSNNFDKKFNDSLLLHFVKKSDNYEISIVRSNNSTLCSCSYKLNDKPEILQIKKLVNSGNHMVTQDSVVQLRVFEPLKQNCIEQYRSLMSPSPD